MTRITDTFLLLSSVMKQLLAFDPTQRLSAEAALKLLHRGSLRPSEGLLQRGASPPRASVAAGNENAEGAGDVGACDGDFWKLESILRVGDLRAPLNTFFVACLLPRAPLADTDPAELQRGQRQDLRKDAVVFAEF